MRLKEIEIVGFKSFAKKSALSFGTPVTAVVGPNGSGKSNVVEAFRFVLGEQSMKSMRGKSGADLIFRGGSGAPKLSRAHVAITFDNSDKVFKFETGETKSPVLFDTVTFSREIFADGTSKYLMNGTEIRLKQMVEILSSVNIGASGHHIISQGEADGILRANSKDRREILEDSLGLKIYHHRIKESESKLAKTLETLKDVQSLRRELAPHLTFLKKQVEKIEKGQVIRNELQAALTRFLSTEKAHLVSEEARIKEATLLIEQKKKELEQDLKSLSDDIGITTTDTLEEIATLKNSVLDLQEKRRGFEQKIGRLEGMIEAHRVISQSQKNSLAGGGPSISFAPTEYSQLLSDIEFFVSSIKSATSLEAVQNALVKLTPLIDGLKARQPQLTKKENSNQNIPDIKDTVLELEALQKSLTPLITKEQETQRKILQLEKEREQALQSSVNSTENKYRLTSEIKQCESELQILSVTRSAFVERKERFDQEIKEAGFLFGPSFLHSLNASNVEEGVDMHDLQRSIDRLKIRLEEHSGIGHEVVEEYNSTVERDAFLNKELIDIESSVKNLESLIVDLKKVLDEKFTKGVEKINERFGDFFKTMFGGGNAFLSITLEKKRKRKSDTELLEDEELEELEDISEQTGDEMFERGIDVHVSLPEKKVKELTMLSGGERSLVSIALLFAISQVNPPPFLVLDETDAALDEANSRRYGDMVERLSEYSQLIVVTHNRETMSRASVLYGVTLGTDGGSKLLSIKFDEAVKVAK